MKNHPGEFAVDFNIAPFLVIWETTQACPLACHHCRASARPERSPRELTTDEGKNLLEQVAGMGTKIVVLSGGDPVKRPDLFELIRHGKGLNLRVGTIPAAGDTLTRDLVVKLKESGLDQMALSLDFPTAELHDGFRGTPGAFAKTLEACKWAHEVNLPLQINTTITAKSLPYLTEMGKLVSTLGIVFWEVFFLIPVGRGKDLESLTPESCEEAFKILYDVNRSHDFVLKVTEAQHYRRYVSQREGTNYATMPEMLRRAIGPRGTFGLAPRAVNSGNGFLFISHEGEIFPSGFLPARAGNIRRDPLAAIYRESDIFTRLRNPALLLGRCGRCEFKEICGGSRSRAYAMTHNEFASEPWCVYEPRKATTSLPESALL